MIETRPVWMGMLGLALSASCGIDAGESRRIAVDQPNSLGVSTLVTERIADHGNDVFTLRALSAGELEVARVELTVGSIDGLSSHSPGADDRGSEIVISVGGRSRHVLSRETARFRLVPEAFQDREIESLLSLEALSPILEHDANISLPPAPTVGPETAFTLNSAGSCPVSYLLTTPVARECCLYNRYNPAEKDTHFVNPAEAIVIRRRNPTNGACKAQDGMSSCSGAACYYGPNGFARAQLITPPDGSPYGRINFASEPSVGSECWGSHDTSSNPYPHFSDVTGTFPVSQGCPGGATGDGEWDY